MATTTRIPVEWKVIQWAIDNGEKDNNELEKKYNLTAWETPKSDRDFPTFKQLQSFSHDTRTPFNYLFKKSVPNEQHEFVKYRTINNANVQPSRRLIDTIHGMESRQAWMKQYLTAQDEQRKFEFFRYLDLKMSPVLAAERIEELLGLSKVFGGLAISDDQFFNVLRERISSLGVMVMQSGIVESNTHRSLDVDEFRAFALIDPVIPLIFINSVDGKKAKVFSLIHEFVHVLLEQSEVLNVAPDVDVANERWVNLVTVNVLMPAEQVRLLIDKQLSSTENLKRLSKRFHVSILATAIRTKELRIFGDDEIKWAKTEQDNNLGLKQKSNGGNYYNNVVSRVDKRFANAVINNESGGKLDIASAAAMLGVSLKTYQPTIEKILGLE